MLIWRFWTDANCVRHWNPYTHPGPAEHLRALLPACGPAAALVLPLLIGPAAAPLARAPPYVPLPPMLPTALDFLPGGYGFGGVALAAPGLFGGGGASPFLPGGYAGMPQAPAPSAALLPVVPSTVLAVASLPPMTAPPRVAPPVPLPGITPGPGQQPLDVPEPASWVLLAGFVALTWASRKVST